MEDYHGGKSVGRIKRINIKIRTIYLNIINYGLKETWSFDKKRTFRQVNEFNYLFTLIAFTLLPVAVFNHNYSVFIIQFLSALGYAGGFYLVGREKLKEARFFAICLFEINIFIHSAFTVYPTEYGFLPWYSPVFIVYMIFPMIAALFDKSVFRHLLIAFSMIIVIQIIAPYSSKHNFNALYKVNVGFIITYTTIYVALIGAVIVYLISSETRIVKDKEIERSEQLEYTLKELKSSRDVIQKQADELKKINDSKDKLFSIIAHDLRSPFNAILGLSELLKEKDTKDPESHLFARKIYETALNNYNLLENLLEWSRTQMNLVHFVPDNLKLIDKVTQNIKLLEASADKKKISVENKVDNNLKVWADRNLVNIILRNLLGNAIKFTRPEGKIIIASKIVRNYAEISVKDNGLGMSEDIIQTLFKIDKVQSRKGTSDEKGTGLGLILCQEFVELLGGEIRVESKENQGSAFYFTLPLAQLN
jgi:signal transduction histidine kinase